MEPQEVTRKITMLCQMTVARGATLAEEEVAALKIGKLVIRHGLPMREVEKVREVERIVYRERTAISVIQERGEWVSLDPVRVLDVSGKAVLVLLTFSLTKLEAWFPFSQIREASDIGEDSRVGDIGELIASWWICEKKQLF